MSDQSNPQERALKITLVTAFLAALGLGGSRSHQQAQISLIDLGLMGLATHRIGRMIAFERVAEPPEPRAARRAEGAGQGELRYGETRSRPPR